MSRKVKTCHNCASFVKWMGIEGSVGLCDSGDGRINNGHTQKCSYWKGIKYNRLKQTEGMEVSDD